MSGTVKKGTKIMGEALSTSRAFTVSDVIESLPLTRAKRQLLSRITDLDIAGKKRGLGGCIAKTEHSVEKSSWLKLQFLNISAK